MTPPARILFVDPVGEKGGAEVVIVDLVRHLDRTRFLPLVACLRPGPLADEIRALDVEAFELPEHRARQPVRVAGAIRALGDLVEEHGADVVHVNAGHLLVYGSLAARRRKAAVVWHVHDPLDRWGWFERGFFTVQRRLRPDWTVFANPTAARSYLARYPNITRHSTILPGVDVDDAPGDGPRARAELGIPETAPVAAMFARLQSHKGHLHLVEAAARLAPSIPDLHVVACGGTLFGQEPEYGERVRSRVDELGLGDRIHLPGHVSDDLRRGVLAAASVAVHPADSEPFGIAVVEAMAAGKPVVVTDADGPGMLVEHGRTGLVVPRGDVDALADAIAAVVGDSDRALAMGEAGRERSRAFGVSAMVRATEAVYDELLGSASGFSSENQA